MEEKHFYNEFMKFIFDINFLLFHYKSVQFEAEPDIEKGK